MDAPEKSKRQPTRYSKKWLLIFVIGCAGLLYASVWGLAVLRFENTYLTCFGTLFPADTDVERSAFFKLPTSAHDLEYDAIRSSSTRTCRIWIKFEIDPGDLKVFQDSTLIKDFETNQRISDKGFKLSLQEKGWTQPAQSIAGSGRLDDYFYTPQWIFIDTTNPDTFIVYIILRQDIR